MAQIPERLVNFNVYNGAAQLLGMATVELPSFEAMTETIAGAGIAGEYSSPVLGHFSSQMVKLAFRTITSQVFALLAPSRHVLDIRGSVQIQDPMRGTLTTEAWRIECTGQTKSSNLGRFEPGKVMGAELDLECAVIRVAREGVPLIEIDKFNMIYKISGVDYLAKVRRDVGGV
jgi:P2 family phage contractile tail tube protein